MRVGEVAQTSPYKSKRAGKLVAAQSTHAHTFQNQSYLDGHNLYWRTHGLYETEECYDVYE